MTMTLLKKQTINTDLTLGTLFSIALTKEAMDKFSETGSRVEAVKAEALVACTRYECSSFVHFLGLASVVSRPVHLVYPDVNFHYRMLIHRSLYPRSSPASFQPLVDAAPMYILWSRDGNFNNTPGSWFEPNHFVPLISDKEEVTTCPTTCPKKREIKDCTGQKAKQQATLSSFLTAKPTGESSQASKSTSIGSPSGQKRTVAAAKLSKEVQPDAKKSPAPLTKHINKSKMLYKWKEEFPWLTIRDEDKAFLCSLRCKAPDVAGNTQFLTGCFSIKKDSMQKHAKSNGHLRTQTAVLAMQKPVRETVIAQSLSKGRKDEEERDRREVAVKMTTAYFIAKEELPFSKFQGTPGWWAAKTRHFIIMHQQSSHFLFSTWRP